MGILLWIPAALLLASGGYLFLIAPGMKKSKAHFRGLLSFHYAHRGLHDASVPENSLAAFRRAMEKGYGIELDVHLTKDGRIAVHHDGSILRICGAEREIRASTLEELRQYPLGKTAERIPALEEVLDLIQGRVPLLIELKPDRLGDKALAEKLLSCIADYPGKYCVQSFDPLILRRFKKHAPHVIRGQLAWNRRPKPGKKRPLWAWMAAHLLFNFLSRPDFVAYDHESDHNFSFRMVRTLFRPVLAAWTVRSQEDSESLKGRYDLQIFEAFDPRPQ